VVVVVGTYTGALSEVEVGDFEPLSPPSGTNKEEDNVVAEDTFNLRVGAVGLVGCAGC
jgi:hypothetical protein